MGIEPDTEPRIYKSLERGQLENRGRANLANFSYETKRKQTLPAFHRNPVHRQDTHHCLPIEE